MWTLLRLSLWSGAVSSDQPDWGYMPTLSGGGAALKRDAAEGASSRLPTLTDGCSSCGARPVSSLRGGSVPKGCWPCSTNSGGCRCWHPHHICLGFAVPEGVSGDDCFLHPRNAAAVGCCPSVITQDSRHRLAPLCSARLPNVLLWAQRFPEAFFKPSASDRFTPVNHRMLM